jgi:hypothetical protein
MYLYDYGFSAEKQINYRFVGFVPKMLAGLSVWKWVILGRSCIKLAKTKVLSLITYMSLLGYFFFGKTQVVS